jgi:hypothetical protein
MLLNVRLLQNACTSTTKALLLHCSECQIGMNRLNEQIKGYYHIIVISQTTSRMCDWLTINFNKWHPKRMTEMSK